MNRTKNIKIQIWTDLYYVRTIGIWYPDVADTSTLDPVEPEQLPTMDTASPAEPNDLGITTITPPKETDAPFLIVTASMFTPRAEVLGTTPIARGQSPIPKEDLERLVRNMSYMFANEVNMFQPQTKAHANTFLDKQTMGYKMVKEVPMTVTPVQGSMSLKDLKDSIEQYSEEEQKSIQVINAVEKPETTAGKHIEEFVYGDKTDNQSMYITVTKLHDIYETEDPYIKATQLPDPKEVINSGTEEAPASIEAMEETADAIETDTVEREALETFDGMTEESAPTADSSLPETDSETPEPTRVEVLEQLLKDKNQQLIDAGIVEEKDPLAGLPEPSTEGNGVEEVSEMNEEVMSEDDIAYAALTTPPTNNDIDDGMPMDAPTP